MLAAGIFTIMAFTLPVTMRTSGHLLGSPFGPVFILEGTDLAGDGGVFVSLLKHLNHSRLLRHLLAE
jgi:hypothetical protein